MSWDRFALHIILGNEAMKSPQDVKWALQEVAARLDRGAVEGTIQDINGNTVGDFQFKTKHEDNDE